MLKESDVVRLIPNLLGVKNDLVGLPGFRKACNDFVRYVCSQVDAESEGHVVQTDDITKLFAACKLQDNQHCTVESGKED